MEKQMLLDGSFVPVAPHRDDVVICSDGSECPRLEAFTDCEGEYHRDECDKDDANDDIVRELLDAEDKWIGEYVASDDYGDGYAYLVFENPHGFRARIGEWLDDNCEDSDEWNASPAYTGKLRESIIDDLVTCVEDSDLESKYHPSEYACWSDGGCCLDSFEVGEYEDQIEIAGRPELEALDESGDLEGCLGRYNGDLYISCNTRYDKASGRRVKTGYVDHDCFWAYSAGWGRWHYVVSDNRMNELLCAAIVEYCRRVDCKG